MTFLETTQIIAIEIILTIAIETTQIKIIVTRIIVTDQEKVHRIRIREIGAIATKQNIQKCFKTLKWK